MRSCLAPFLLPVTVWRPVAAGTLASLARSTKGAKLGTKNQLQAPNNTDPVSMDDPNTNTLS